MLANLVKKKYSNLLLQCKGSILVLVMLETIQVNM